MLMITTLLDQNQRGIIIKNPCVNSMEEEKIVLLARFLFRIASAPVFKHNLPNVKKSI